MVGICWLGLFKLFVKEHTKHEGGGRRGTILWYGLDKLVNAMLFCDKRAKTKIGNDPGAC